MKRMQCPAGSERGDRRAVVIGSACGAWRSALLTIALLGPLVVAPTGRPIAADPLDDPDTASVAAQMAEVDSVEASRLLSPPVSQGSSPTKPASGHRSVLATVSVPWRTIPFTIRTLPPERRFELRDGTVSTRWPPTKVHDRFGVPMRIINGYRRYHPVGLARLGLKYLSRYRGTNDPLYLDRAERIAAGLERIGVRARNAIWFPYRHTFTMHGDPDYVNRPPWYSGYAQGFALALFVRLWELTGTDTYRVLADQTYNSLRNLGRGSTPWVSWVERGRYLWIEEYPQRLDRTFNGHVFALIGLHDYFVMTKDPELYSAARNANVLDLLRGGITTIRAFAATFRNPGAVSDYCLAHHYRNPTYHAVHIRLLRYLRVMTGDPWFSRMADLFAADVR